VAISALLRSLHLLIPVMLLLGTGYLLGWRLRIDPQPLSRLALYGLSPALVLAALKPKHLPGAELLWIATFSVAMLVAALLLSALLASLLHLDRARRSGLALTTAFANTANLGLPVVALVLGSRGEQAGVLFVLTQVVLLNTVGALVAGSHNPDGRLLRRTLGLPSLWALGLVLILSALQLPLPQPVAAAAQLGSAGYVPVVLISLGITLARTRLLTEWDRVALIGTGARLLVMPALGWLILSALPLAAVAQHALLLQAAMPVAVNAYILAQEFQSAGGQVAATVFSSLLGGLLTIPLLSSWLR
jgi:predicted permease